MKRALSAASTRIRQRRHYTDAALLWGQANPQQAQLCLQPPSLVSKTTINRPQNWSEFWKWRNWNFSSDSSSREHEQAIVSHVLTGPLTLARAAADERNIQHWTCLGARAESMLPVPYWNEFLYYYSDDDKEPTPHNTSLSFVGPECDNVPSQQQLTWKHHTLTLEWSFRGKYHDMPPDSVTTTATSSSSDPHGFILFNPGFGHPHLQKDWRPTLEKLWKNTAGKPTVFVLTAHSELDAERDWKLWHSFDSTIPSYVENPWASQITYQDPWTAITLCNPISTCVIMC